MSLSGSPTDQGRDYLHLADIRLGEIDSLLSRPDVDMKDSPTQAYLNQTLGELRTMISNGGNLLIGQVRADDDQTALHALADFLLTERQRVADLSWRLPPVLQSQPPQIVALMDQLARQLQMTAQQAAANQQGKQGAGSQQGGVGQQGRRRAGAATQTGGVGGRERVRQREVLELGHEGRFGERLGEFGRELLLEQHRDHVLGFDHRDHRAGAGAPVDRSQHPFAARPARDRPGPGRRRGHLERHPDAVTDRLGAQRLLSGTAAANDGSAALGRSEEH